MLIPIPEQLLRRETLELREIPGLLRPKEIQEEVHLIILHQIEARSLGWKEAALKDRTLALTAHRLLHQEVVVLIVQVHHHLADPLEALVPREVPGAGVDRAR